MVRYTSSLDSSQASSIQDSPYHFRLQDGLIPQADTFSLTERGGAPSSVSAYSLYKMKIDSMFDETRSHLSLDTENLRRRKLKEDLITNLNHYRILEPTDGNTVQAKIERMFEEIANVPVAPIKTANRFLVRYLGCVGLNSKVTSLEGLQTPLKELYLSDLKRTKKRLGTLEITSTGLKADHGGEESKINTFDCIAVWAAVKFICRPIDLEIPVTSSPLDGIPHSFLTTEYEYSFLPLIADPSSVDKSALFRRLSTKESSDLKIACRSNNYGIDRLRAPMFTVVMRCCQDSSNAATKSSRLECHAYMCRCSEDAIVIAANLYQALMGQMHRNESKIAKNPQILPEPVQQLTSNRQMRQSLGPSSSSDGSGSSAITPNSNKTPSNVPQRPPRRRKQSNNSSGEEGANSPVISENKHGGRSSGTPTFTLPPPPPLTPEEPLLSSSHSQPNIGAGDILTKVAIPRSRSFLTTVGGRYNRKFSNPDGTSGSACLGGGSRGSPLGFRELFAEFSCQEGLSNVDEILDAILDPQGMSFNDLKPIYKEFLMKLAMTLTKDELYQRSKLIMRRQRKKLERRSTKKRPRVPVGFAFRRVFGKSVRKLRASRAANLEFTSVLYPPITPQQDTPKRRHSFGGSSTSSGLGRDYCLHRAGVSGHSSGTKAAVKNRMKAKNNPRGLQNRSSSGYFSCSECSFDSESCGTRCYCSQGESAKDRHNYSLTSCNCSTDSCLESDKCYCYKKHRQQKILHHQQQQQQILQTQAQHERLRRLNNNYSKEPETHLSNRQRRISSSLEYLATPLTGRFAGVPSISAGSSKLNIRRRSHSTDDIQRDSPPSASNKILVVSARDPKGRIIFMGANNDSMDPSSSQSKLNSHSHSSNTHHEALSVKKSAEIAAAMMNQPSTTSNHHHHQDGANGTHDSELFYSTLDPNECFLYSRNTQTHQQNCLPTRLNNIASSDLESSLGYLP